MRILDRRFGATLPTDGLKADSDLKPDVLLYAAGAGLIYAYAKGYKKTALVGAGIGAYLLYSVFTLKL